jgi:short subunit dehydrogenase-like uncharacterized protein
MDETRIVLFGATGYTGELVARSLVDAGVYPVLAGRSEDRLAHLADELGGLEYVSADAGHPDGTVRELLDEGDVLVTTVGPFLRHGEPALRAAVNAGAHYLDSTGEPAFIRQVFDEFHVPAAGRCALLSAFGYDYVPGNLAAGLALREADGGAVRVDVGYFVQRGEQPGRRMSRGTAASAAGMTLEPGFAFRDGELKTVRTADRVGSFTVADRRLEGIAVGGSEHLSLPRLWPDLREVNVYLGWFGPRSDLIRRASVVPYALGRVPGVKQVAAVVADAVADRVGVSAADEGEVALGTSHVVAIAYDAGAQPLAEVHLEGPDPYRLTGDLLAWGARRAASVGVEATGAVGPVEAFGLDALEAGCAEAGLVPV